ncbi:MAG: glycosyltransferase [Phycisphaerae bacterium]|jgi:glycosyltransferase involved in cell wall biosynthesis|nr:glycosyltransferase [Phycisphaerae bacterium]
MTGSPCIVELATNDTLGGAARSAYRLHLGLRGLGLDVRMLARWKHSNDPSVHQVEADTIDANRVATERAIRHRWVRDNRTELTDTLFSLGHFSIDVSLHPLVRQADVLHMHWVANFLGPESFASLAALRRPLVWTLHDEWAYTGGCHYTAACEQFRRGCSSCPQLREDPLRLVERFYNERRDAWRDARLSVVTPSRWLAARAGESPLLGNHDVQVIPYGLDTTTFAPPSPEAKRVFRVRHGISRDAFVIAFGVDRIGERRKGYHHLIRAIAAVRESLRNVHLLRFGDATDAAPLDLPTTDLGSIHDDSALALAYGAADAFVLPTLEDNLPNGVLEALACATPVIAYATGGVPDVIVDGTTGWLAPTGRVDELAARLSEASRDIEAARRMGLNGRLTILREHTLRIQAQRYQRLYDELLEGDARARREAVA